ncbi:hybrid sensor histidine kinase/response regulator [Mongoliimonas terrestris]|uniref:PAS domain S-box protein n=1 Tax=Mongoliimonas terrestris TaxID=1709001 RepID=UPI000949A026
MLPKTRKPPPPGDRYRMLVDAITDYAVYMLDPNGIVSSWNPGARRFKGYEEAEIVGRHFSCFYTEEEQSAGVPAAALRTAERNGRFETEGWRVRKDGGRFWAFVIIDPIRDADGHLVGFAKVTRDLSERREAEAALRRSEEQFRLLVQGVSDYAIYMVDPQGTVVSWNQGAERIKGYRTEEILGRHFSLFYAEPDLAIGLPRTALETAAREGRFEREGWRVRKDGSRFMAHVVIDPVRNADGQLIGFAKVTRDITERLEVQRRLEEAREALFQVQKMEAVGQLSAGVAHDFNNLLAAILGGLELLRKRLPDDPRAHRLLDTVVQAADRGAALTSRVLTFARRQELAVQPVDVGRLFDGMADLLHRSIGPHIRIERAIPADLPPVSTDPNHLETALLNLALNARDAMPSGGVLGVTAAVDADLASGRDGGTRFVRISVTDTGEGMDAATLNRAIEPFFTTKGVGKGTGLGLSMVHGLAAQSGGRMVVESRPGSGTRVDIILPVASPITPAASRAAPVDAGQRPAAAPVRAARRLSVLVVDDDDLVLASSSAMLEDMGHQVEPAASGPAALAAFAARSFDLVLTDQMMPGMTGLDLIDRLRALDRHVPVILASGYADLPAVADPTLVRLAKPFTQQALADCLDRATGSQGRA